MANASDHDPDQLRSFYQAQLPDPYPIYRQLRSEDPVHWSDLIGAWILTRYDDVKAVTNDPRFSSVRAHYFMDQLPETAQQRMQPLGHQLELWLIHLDPPDHSRVRALVHKAFVPRVVEQLRPFIHKIVNELLDGVELAGAMDVMRDFAYPLTAAVIAELLGIRQADRTQFSQWSDNINGFVGAAHVTTRQAEKAQRSMLELMEYLHTLIEARRHSPTDDLLSSLIAVEEQGDKLNEEELLALCVLLLFAGHETTANQIGNALLALLRNPDQLQKLQQDPELTASAVEELLRFDSSVQRLGRVAIDDINICGRQIRQGEFVAAMLGAANRDPVHFAEPDTLDFERNQNNHLSFGYGRHYCIGAPLARLELEIAINRILSRFPALRLGTAEVEWYDNFGQRFLRALPVVF
ncbi:MAG: cytochrome P450 [Chloroflexi bacterium]|nr:cytochrome P450 [Chloroflexota bacterium]